MSFIGSLEQFFGNPLVGFAMAALGLYASYHFYVKQKREQGGLERIIQRLQEENAKLRELMNTEVEASPDPSRESVIINLRALLQSEDRHISGWKTAVPAFAITSAIWIFAIVISVVWDRVPAGGVVAVIFLGGIANLFCGAFLADRFEKSHWKTRITRIRSAFMDAKPSLREIDNLSDWAASREWVHINRNWFLEVFQIWGAQLAKDWTSKDQKPPASDKAA